MTNETITTPNIVVNNHNGVHARPASYIFQIAKKYPSCKITLNANNKTANARSLVAILGLGLKLNHTLTITAEGEGCNDAVAEITRAFNDGLGESAGTPHNISANKVDKEVLKEKKADTLIIDFSKPVALAGVIASPGLIVGHTTIFKPKEITFSENSTDKAAETQQLNLAFELTASNLKAELEVAKKQSNKIQSQIIQAHMSLLEDEALIESCKDYINNGKTAAYSVNSAIDNNIEILKSTNDQLLSERAADLKDIRNRILKVLLNIKDDDLVFAKNTIIIANDLVPSDIAKFHDNVVGIMLAKGSATTHVALILRNKGIPSVVALGKSVLNIPNQTSIIIDANQGNVIVNPTEEILKSTVEEQEKLARVKQENAQNAHKPAITADGVEIKIKGNVSNAQEAHKALSLGAVGIGLLRSEFLFFNSTTPPDHTQQTSLYQATLDAMQGGSVTIRTLDVGGDKPLPYVKIDKEENPIMGIRGVRSYLDNMEVILAQIKGILQVKPLRLVKIMLPMVADVDDFIQIKEIIIKEAEELGITEPFEIGTMIEIPSAALTAASLAEHADFLSIGTNDLAQYTMAMDRGNPLLGKKLSNLSPALLMLIDITVKGAAIHKKPVSVCGAMASELRAIPILIGLGIRELSSSGRSIPDVKALIRTLDYKKCVKVAQAALKLGTPKEVENLIKENFNL